MQVGTLTDQGIFLGMQGRLARFERNLGAYTTSILCSPTIAKVITQEDEDKRLALEAECIENGPWYQAVLRGDEARSALSSLTKSLA
jgi:hypothetical protein